jgi:hypothetical protein
MDHVKSLVIICGGMWDVPRLTALPLLLSNWVAWSEEGLANTLAKLCPKGAPVMPIKDFG